MAEVKSALIGLIERYEELRALKDELSEATKEINEEYKKIQEEIVEQMVDDDIPSQGYGDYSYSPQTVTHYSFISEESLAEKGIDKMAVAELSSRGRQSTWDGELPLAHAQIICLPLRTQDVSAIL